MRWFLVILVLATGMLYAQEEPENAVKLQRLTGYTGLNTVDLHPQPTEALVAHNVDLSRSGVGSIAKRYGFEKVDSLTAIDSINYLYALQFDNGTKYMMVIGADPDSGWGRIYVSNEGSENFEQDSLTEIYSRFPITGDIYVAKLRDDFYVTNGVARGVVIGRIGQSWSVRPFPMIAPGEPLLVPIAASSDTATYRLDGTYRYVFRVGRRDAFPSPFDDWDAVDSTGPNSIYSDPIKVNDGKVYMTNFQWMGADSLTGATDSLCLVAIFRTKGDFGTVDASDYAYYLGSWIMKGSDAELAAAVKIDSIPDASLSATDSVKLWDEQLIGFDENSGAMNRRYGAPALLSRDSWAAADTMYTGDKIGPYFGWPDPEGTAQAQGVGYLCTYIDTVTAIESRAGAPYIIIRDQSDTVRSYTLSLPLPPSSIGDIGINLYRAPLRVLTHSYTKEWKEQTGCFNVTVWFWFYIYNADRTDSTLFRGSNSGSFCSETSFNLWLMNIQAGTPYPVDVGPRVYQWVDRYKDVRVVDTVYVEQYRLVDQIFDTATIYVDSLRQDSLASHAPLEDNTVPPFLNATFAYNGRLYGADGSRVYRSEGSDVGSWGLFDAVDVNPGYDEITAGWPGQFALRWTMAFSNYNIVASSFLDAEIVGRWGCIAPKSLSLTPVGPIYLGANGVVLETDGQYLERTIVPGIISEKLQNFAYKDALELKNAVGMWLPREKQYWLNIGDTTFVWDLRASERLKTDVWTTSSVDFAGGTLYDTTGNFEVVPGRTLYFWRNGDTRIYRYGSTITDTAYAGAITVLSKEVDYDVDSGGWQYIPILYRTGPLLWNAEQSQIRKIGLLANFDGTIADSAEALGVRLVNERQVILDTLPFLKLYNRYIRSETAISPALYYYVDMFSYNLGSVALYSGTGIEALDVWYIENAEEIPSTY